MRHPDKLATFIRKVAEKSTDSVPVELVINGDFVDFLAHEHAQDERWTSFAYKPGAALRAFEQIVSGPDKPVFDALADFVKKNRLTLMLGNHDLELCLPEVRAALLRSLGDAPLAHLCFLYDGEALQVGDAIIEHGNAHDPANAVDFDGLRYLRAIRSRGYLDLTLQRRAFRPPPGSELVATVMNPLKERYAFLDLLKPESEALFSLLLAIEPDARDELRKLAGLVKGVAKNSLPKLGFPASLANVSAAGAGAEADPDALAEVIADALQADATVDPMSRTPSAPALADVSVGSWLESKLGLFRSLFERGDADLDARLPALRQAFRALEGDYTWKPDVEAGRRYLRAAKTLAADSGERSGYRFVVFGHTHHAKCVDLPDEGAVYLNSGTWANLLEFPSIPKNDDAAAETIIRRFADDLKQNRFAKDDRGLVDHADTSVVRQIFHPTYVRLDVKDDGKYLDGARLCTYDWKAERVE